MPRLQWVFVELYKHTAGRGDSRGHGVLPAAVRQSGVLHDRYLTNLFLKISGDGDPAASQAPSGSI